MAKYESKGSTYGQSVAGMMYLLAEGLGRADIDSVWCVLIFLLDERKGTDGYFE